MVVAVSYLSNVLWEVYLTACDLMKSLLKGSSWIVDRLCRLSRLDVVLSNETAEVWELAFKIHSSVDSRFAGSIWSMSFNKKPNKPEWLEACRHTHSVQRDLFHGVEYIKATTLPCTFHIVLFWLYSPGYTKSSLSSKMAEAYRWQNCHHYEVRVAIYHSPLQGSWKLSDQSKHDSTQPSI
jgi:hypothetical protein